MTDISVLICTYNRPHLLAKSLDALICHTSEKPVQVVVVNGGDEQASRVVSKYDGRMGIQVKLVATNNKNLAASRNVGLPYCTGEVVAMTDDDAEVFPDWIAQINRLHSEHPEAGAVGGVVIGDNPHSLINRIADQVTFPGWNTPQYVRTLPGVNISYKRTIVAQIGLQDETLFRGEDVDYNWRIKKLGYEIYYDPSVCVLHHHRSTFGAFLNQQYMYGRAYYLVRRKWPEMYCVYPHSFSSLHDLLKALNFVLAIFYVPVLQIFRLSSILDSVLALPLLCLHQIVWRGGMIRQRLLS